MYQRARSGELAEFTGISSPYEPPTNPKGRIDTSITPIDEAIKQLKQMLSKVR